MSEDQGPSLEKLRRAVAGEDQDLLYINALMPVIGDFVRLALYCLDKLSGLLKWEFDTTITAPDGTKIFSSPAVANSRLYVGSSKFFFFCIGKWEQQES